MADLARPGLRPVFPKIWLNVLLAFLFASFFSVGAAVLSDVLDNTVRDPDQISRLLIGKAKGNRAPLEAVVGDAPLPVNAGCWLLKVNGLQGGTACASRRHFPGFCASARGWW